MERIFNQENYVFGADEITENTLFKAFREAIVNNDNQAFNDIGSEFDQIYDELESITPDKIGAAEAEHNHDTVYSLKKHSHTAEEAKALSINGGDMLGNISMNGNTLYIDDENKQGVGLCGGYSESLKPYVEILGSEGDEAVILSSIADPEASDHAANKRYVDGQISVVNDTISGQIAEINEKINDIDCDSIGAATEESVAALPAIFVSTLEPDNSKGKDGDIWIVYEES